MPDETTANVLDEGRDCRRHKDLRTVKFVRRVVGSAFDGAFVIFAIVPFTSPEKPSR